MGCPVLNPWLTSLMRTRIVSNLLWILNKVKTVTGSDKELEYASICRPVYYNSLVPFCPQPSSIRLLALYCGLWTFCPANCHSSDVLHGQFSPWYVTVLMSTSAVFHLLWVRYPSFNDGLYTRRLFGSGSEVPQFTLFNGFKFNSVTLETRLLQDPIHSTVSRSDQLSFRLPRL